MNHTLLFWCLGLILQLGCQVRTATSDDDTTDWGQPDGTHGPVTDVGPAHDATQPDATPDTGTPDMAPADATLAEPDADRPPTDAGEPGECMPGPAERLEGNAHTSYIYDDEGRLILETLSSLDTGEVLSTVSYAFSPGEVVIETDIIAGPGIEIREIQQLDDEGRPVTAQNFRGRAQTNGVWNREFREDGSRFVSAMWTEEGSGEPTMCHHWEFDRVGRLSVRAWKPDCGFSNRLELYAYAGDGRQATLTVSNRGDVTAVFTLVLNHCGQPIEQIRENGQTAVTWTY